jgi:hypothetical protein
MMAILCDACGKVISTIYHIHIEDMFFCSYRCFKTTNKCEDIDYSAHKREVSQVILGVDSNIKDKNVFLQENDASGSSMVRATSFERTGEFKKAINCWKRILILHSDDEVVTQRANDRIKTLERKLKSKHQGLKEGIK